MNRLRNVRTKHPHTQSVPLLDNNHNGTGQNPGQQDAARSRGQRLARALGMSLVYHLYYKLRHWGGSVEEAKKIALRKDLWMACLAGSIHILPITASMVLVVLNWRGYYIGSELAGPVGQDDARFIGLQFAAKVHELTISASLTAVIFSYVRHELMTDSGLPFGAIVAGLQFKEISYLWSLEFWGAVRASWRRKRDKTVLILLIITCCCLALSAGPSSATLMRPRLDNWPAGGTDFWIALTPDELYSTNASAIQVPASCMNDTGDLSCPSGGWQILADDYLLFYQSWRPAGYLPDFIYVAGQKAVRALRAYSRAPNFQFTASQTTVTAGSSSVADALVETGRLWAWAAYNWRANERFWSRIDVTYRVGAQQPIVQARCTEYNASSYVSGLGPDTLPSTIAVYDLSDPNHLDPNGDFLTLQYNYTVDEQVRSLVQNAFNESVPQIAWSTVPQSDGTALGATLNVPMKGYNISWLYQCTIAARLAPGLLTSTRDNPLVVTGNDHLSIYDNNNTLPRISIDPAWAAFLNPTNPSSNSTAYQYMMQVAGILDYGSALGPEGAVYAIESLLSLSVVNGLARRDFGAGFSGTLVGDTNGLWLVDYRDSYLEEPDEELYSELDCTDWCKQFLPLASYTMSYGGNAFNISNAEKAASTQLSMLADAQGLAYNPRGSAAKFAMFALLLYVCIALGHLVYTVWNRETSSSWDSISELVALAVRSDQSERLVNTGAGINSLANFKHRTQVIDKDGRLQLAIGEPVGQYDAVKPNEYYG